MSGSAVAAATAVTSAAAAASPPAQPPPPPPPPPPQPQPPPPLPEASSGAASAASAAAEPELVSLILNRLKSQGLFDQFRRDCLADVDTKPAYQNLRQRVDNFVSNHLATHTWSPHLNKNQLRNNIRQQVLKSGMLESGIDRIISQVVDPKINHIFRPQVEKAVHEFLSTLNHKEEASPSTAPPEEKPDASILMQGVCSTIPSASVANDAMSILETITSLNQEASAARASTEAANLKTNDRISKRVLSQQSVDGSIERDRNAEDLLDDEKPPGNSTEESSEPVANCEDVNNSFSSSEEGKTVSKEINSVVNPSKEIVQENDEQRSKLMDKCDRKPENLEKERRKEKKEKSEKKVDLFRKTGDDLKGKEEKAAKDKETELIKYSVLEKSSSKHKANGSTKEALEDSDVDILSDITVSSVHTSDLSSFEEESEDEVALSDSTEEGEIVSDDEENEQNQVKTKPEAGGANEKKVKPGRHAYVHKPYLYSKYYSDSDDERTVEQRRQSVAREKEERLLRRRLNREKLEEKRKQKAAEKTKMLKTGNQGKSIQNLEESSSKGPEQKASGASIKDVLKEQRFFEKKVALSRKRKRESRHDEEGRKRKLEQPEEDLGEPQKLNESGEKSKEVKASQGKNEGSKLIRKLPESVHSADENRSDSKIEKEHKRKSSSSLQTEGVQQDGEFRDTKSQFDRAETNPEESQKQKNVLKSEKHIKKDDSETPNVKCVAKKEARLSKDKNEKERSISEDKSLIKHKYKGDGVHKTAEDVECLPSERGLKSEENSQKHSQLLKTLSDDKAERKNKHRSERKTSVNSKDVKNTSDHASKNEENSRKENNRKDRQVSTDKLRAEHKVKRLSSDSRPQKESQSISKQHSSATSRKSESYSDDKHDAESSNVDNTVKQSDSIHKDRRKSRSALEDRFSLKSKSKSHSKVIKAPESELQDSSFKQESGQKLDKDKNMEEADLDKQWKSKTEIKVSEENSVELKLESGAHSVSSSQKDSTHRVKLQSGEKSSVKEKTKSDKDLGSARLERKLSADGHKSRSVKHSSKEAKKREEDNKMEDKGVKQTESHTKMQENSLFTDKRPTKRISSENRKGSMSAQEIDVGGEKLATSVAVPFPAHQKTSCTSGHSFLSEQSQEPVEVKSEQKHGNAPHQIEGESSNNSQQAAKFKSTAKDQLHHNSVHEENKTLHTKELSKPSLSSINNPKQKELFSTKEISIPSDAFKQTSKNVGSSKQKQCHAITESETNDKILLDASPKENAKLQFQRTTEEIHDPKNVKNTIALSEGSSPPSKNSSRENVIPQKSMDKDLGEVTVPLSGTSKGKSFNLYSIKDTISDHQTHTVKMEQKDSLVLSSNIKEGDSTSMEIRNTDGKVHLSCTQSPEDSKSALADIQEAVVPAKIESALADTVQNDSLTGSAIQVTHVSADQFTPTKLEEQKDNSGEGPSARNNEAATEGKGETKENHSTDAIIELSSGSIPENVPGDTSKVSAMVSEAEGRSGDTRPQSENSVVGSSVGGSSCISTCSSMETDALIIGTSTERTIGSALKATSTEEGLGEEAISDLQREGDATITCSEEQGQTALSCTSIEADEGFTVGTWTKNKEGVRFETEKCFRECTVTAAEESGSVTEGLPVCESSSTSTKEGESAECVVNYAEEGTKPLINESGIEFDQSMNSSAAEEKDDAVTSAGSEERCMASVCGDTSTFDNAAACTGETESDGAVTSAGTEAQDGSVISGNPDECQNHATGTEQIKGAEGAVTCTGTERASVCSAVCSVTGTDSQEESVVTGVFAESDNHVAAGPRADKSDGESAVTSTGITAEDDPEAASACTGLEDSNEGFAAASDTEEKYEHAAFSTEARAEKSVLEFSRSSYDDERCVTSTGAKEEDEEGENFVTSTGRGNEETEPILACTGTDESARVLVCVEATASVCQAAGQAGAELSELTSNADKDTVGSMMGLEEEMRVDDISNSTKGVVESSTTSAGTGSENNLASVTVKEDESLLTEKFECDGISATSDTQTVSELSAGEEKRESTMSYLDSGKCESLFKIISKKVATLPASANQDDKDEGETISTSVVKVCPAPIHSSAEQSGEQTSPREVENTEKTACLIDAEDFSAPMPSTAVEHASHGSAVKSNEGPTGILEDFDAPMPSLTMGDGGSVFLTVRSGMATGGGANIISKPIVSAGGSGESHAIDGKEESDECSVISTSIIEEKETPISRECSEGDTQNFALRLEQSTDAAMISTSSTGRYETSVFAIETNSVNQVPSTDGKPETFTITTTEGCVQVTSDNLVPIEAEGESEDTVDGTEECKVVQEVGSQKSELLVQSVEKTNQNASTSAEERTKCEAHKLTIGNTTKPDQCLAAVSVENPGNITKVSVRTMAECDSVSTITASEESVPAASEEMPLSFASTETEDEREIAMCAKDSDCSMHSAPESNQNTSAVLHREGQKLHKGEPGGALEESAPSKSSNTEGIEMPANTVDSVSVGTDLCLDSLVSDGSSMEACMHENGFQDNSRQHTEGPSSLSGAPQEEERESENLATGDVNPSPALKTDIDEPRDSSSKKYSMSLLFELGQNSEDKRVLDSRTDLCSQYSLASKNAKVEEHHEPEAFPQRSVMDNNDNKEMLPDATEDVEERTKVKVHEDPRCRNPMKEHLCAKGQPEGVLKEISDTLVITEAVEDKVPKELQVEISDQKEEYFMPETAKYPAVGDSESDHGPVCQVPEEENEKKKYFETEPETHKETTTKDSEEKTEGGANPQEPSLEGVNEKDEQVAKVDSFEKSDLESKLNPAEVNQQVPVKRKRGRPRKYPIEIKAVPGQDSEADVSTGNTMKTSSPSTRPNFTPKGKDSVTKNRRDNETEEGKTEVGLHRRGRKPKRPHIPSEETDVDPPEPDRKRQKLAPAVEEETKDKVGSKESGSNGGDDGGSGGDADEAHSGATTRSASRLEAQRKQPSKPTTRAASKNQSPDPVPPRKRPKVAGKKQSPANSKSNKSPISAHSKLQSPRRKREVSPLVSHKKGHQRADEPEMKKSKR